MTLILMTMTSPKIPASESWFPETDRVCSKTSASVAPRVNEKVFVLLHESDDSVVTY